MAMDTSLPQPFVCSDFCYDFSSLTLEEVLILKGMLDVLRSDLPTVTPEERRKFLSLCAIVESLQLREVEVEMDKEGPTVPTVITVNREKGLEEELRTSLPLSPSGSVGSGSLCAFPIMKSDKLLIKDFSQSSLLCGADPYLQPTSLLSNVVVVVEASMHSSEPLITVEDKVDVD